jgi:glycosyltransferase involved in cell wall biosynthesis
MKVVLEARVVSEKGGGPDKTILNSPRFLTDAGYWTICAYMHPPNDPGFDEIRRKASLLQAPLISIEDRGPFDWRVIARFQEICRRHRVAIWHGHDYKSNLLGLLLRPFWPMHLITTVHGWVKETRRTPLYYAIDRLCLPFYEKVICVSEDLHERSLDAGVRPKRCVLIENAIDTEQYRRTLSLSQARARVNLSNERRLIGAIGRLSPEKGYDHLIRAVDALLRQGHDLDLVIAGEGDDEPRLRQLIKGLGRTERIHLLGYCSDTLELFQAMDIFALSSLREGLPNVILEAMALEVPVVATRIAGVPRVIQHEENGLIVEPGSPQALASALARLLGDETMRLRIGQAGRSTVEERYSFAARMQKMRALYQELDRSKGRDVR